ncbi:FlhC family transcriptional regulator [Methylobacter luteus]|uniref:FlhC family transcriptional regulator n=1 Tax=Methylobacter luteus TaxID=415 RepID=UPI000487A776|nr:FlhC family transcriptional regulator [Methylobacter luteus]
MNAILARENTLDVTHLRLTPKETDILGMKRKLNLATGIIKKEGRPTIVRAVCRISKASAVQLYKEIHGKGPSSGLLPYDPEWVMKSPENCLHASVYCNIHETLVRAETDAWRGEIFLEAYERYEETFAFRRQPVLLNINRAWFIERQISLSDVSRMSCGRCNYTYATIKEYPEGYKFCPICDATIDSLGRQKWRKVNFGVCGGHNRIKKSLYLEAV